MKDVEGVSSFVYDWDDDLSKSGEYGSMQVHAETCQVQFLHLIIGIITKHQILDLENYRVSTLIGHLL